MTKPREFFRYILLHVASMLGLSCYILADTFFVAQSLGADGLAALNLAIPVYSLINGSGLMLGTGGAVRYAVCCGRGNRDEAAQALYHTLLLAVPLCVVFLIAGGFFSGDVALLLGAQGDLYPMAQVYIQCLLLFSPAFLLNQIMGAVIRNDGAPQLATVAMLSGSFSNIILDMVFLFPLGMGMFGAVLATCLAPIISLSILSLHRRSLRRRHHPWRWENRRMQWSVWRVVFTTGLPAFFAEISSGVVILVFNFLFLGLLGSVGVAAYGVIANLSLVACAMMTGVAQGMQPLVSRAWGREDRHDMQRVLRWSLITVLSLAVAITVGLCAGAAPVVQAFDTEGNRALQDIATAGLPLHAVGLPAAGINIVLAMFFAARETPVPAQGITLLRGLIFIIPLAWLMSVCWQAMGVWLSFPAAEGLTLLVAAFWYHREKRKQPHMV